MTGRRELQASNTRIPSSCEIVDTLDLFCPYNTSFPRAASHWPRLRSWPMKLLMADDRPQLETAICVLRSRLGRHPVEQQFVLCKLYLKKLI